MGLEPHKALDQELGKHLDLLLELVKDWDVVLEQHQRRVLVVGDLDIALGLGLDIVLGPGPGPGLVLGLRPAQGQGQGKVQEIQGEAVSVPHSLLRSVPLFLLHSVVLFLLHSLVLFLLHSVPHFLLRSVAPFLLHSWPQPMTLLCLGTSLG